MIHKLFLSLFTLFFLLLTFATPGLAANYGEGEYGTGNYNEGSSGSSGGGGTNPGGCGDPAPTSAPFLFQIDANQTSAILYFTPAGQPYSYYFISYGDGVLDEGYGAQFDLSNSSGSISYLIESLQKNSTYTFKVRAGNGCATGAWSNTLRIKTTNNPKKTTEYYPERQASGFTFDTVRGVAPALISKVKEPEVETQAEPFFTEVTPPPQNNTQITKIETTEEPKEQPSLWERILNFFNF